MRRLSLLALVWLAHACSGAGGCTGCGGAAIPYPDPPPAGGELQAGVVHARLTENLLAFLERQLPALLGSFFVIEDGRAVYELDETLFDPASDPFFLRDGCIGEPDEPCPARSTPAEEAGPSHRSRVALDLDNLSRGLSLAWLAPDAGGRPGLRFVASDVDLFVDLGLVINVPELTGVAACRVRDAGDQAALTVAELSFELRLGIDGSGAAPAFTSAVENVRVDLGGADDSALSLAVAPCDGTVDPTCADPRCVGPYGAFGAPDCPGVCGLIDLFGQLGGFLTQVLTPLLDALAPSLAGAVSDALVGALGDVPLGVETALDLGALAGPLLAETTPIHVAVAASDELDVAGTSPGRGLQLGLDAGFAAAAPAVCAAAAEPPPFAALAGPPPDYTGFVEIADDTLGGSHFEPYHAAVGLSEAMVNQLLFAVHQSGLLCQSLAADEVAELTDGAFSLTAGLLMSFDARLAGLAEPEAPLLIALWAGTPPQVRLGVDGRVAEGIDEPLIEAVFNDLEISIYVQLDDAMTRLTGILTDVVVRFGVERTANQTLELVLDGVALTDTRQVYNELAPEADLSGLLELIVDLALGQLLGDGTRFALEVRDLLAGDGGLPLYVRLNALRRDLGPTGARFLSLYATLCGEDEVADPDNATCYMPKRGGRALSVAARLADDASLYRPVEPPFDPERFDALPSGRARLAVDIAAPERAVAHVRVDGGPWSSARPISAGLLEVESPRLRVLGAHRIEVRVVELGRPATSRSAEVTVRVDRERPVVKLTRRDRLLVVEVDELGSPEDVALFAHASASADGWRRVDSPLRLPLDGVITVVARDANGNLSRPAVLDLGQPVTIVAPEPDAARAQGCAAAPRSWWLLLLGPLALRRRRG